MAKLNVTLDEINEVFADVERKLREDEDVKNTIDMTSVFVFENMVIKKIISKISEREVKR